jgi:ribosomal protein S18 acetylase RimI-like enzyme
MRQAQAPEVVRLREDQIELAAGILARAFHDDPPLVYAIPNAAERSRLLPAFMKTFVTYAHLFGEPYTIADTPASVALWLPLNSADAEDPDGDHRAGVDQIPSILGPDNFGRLQNIIRFVGKLHRRFAPGGHLYLQWLGVEPSCQGQGLGSAMLRPVLRRADAEGLPSYLETFKPRNVALYQRHGFKIMLEEAEPASGCRGWAFLREPR